MNNQYTDKDRIARICWNEHHWKQPSGISNKSKNKKAFEDIAGFGYEEWLFDMDKLIENYHYSFIEAINRHWNKYQNSKFNISIYTINGQTKERWWIGEIKNVEVITRKQSDNILSIYKKKGWIKEMLQQLKIVNADIEQFKLGDPQNNNIFNIRFTNRDLYLLDEPLRFSRKDQIIRASYTGSLLYKKKEPELEITTDTKFVFSPKTSDKKETTIRNYKEHKNNIDLFHNKISDAISKQFVDIYGEQNVSNEQSTGYGTKIDLVVKDNELMKFYEIKTSLSIKLCVRDAFAQLIEYSYFPNNNIADELIVVSPNEMNTETQKYLNHLRNTFSIPIYYQRYNVDKAELEIEKY
jgi:hypothetical protein